MRTTTASWAQVKCEGSPTLAPSSETSLCSAKQFKVRGLMEEEPVKARPRPFLGKARPTPAMPPDIRQRLPPGEALAAGVT